MTDEFLTRLAADLFSNQEEIKLHLLALGKDFGECAKIAGEASQYMRQAAKVTEESAEAAQQSAGAAQQSAEAAQQAARAAELAARASEQSAKAAMDASRLLLHGSHRIDKLENRFSASESKSDKLAEAHLSQAETLKQILEGLRGMLHSNVDTEVWRKEAEKRLSRIEDWIDKQDEAS